MEDDQLVKLLRKNVAVREFCYRDMDFFGWEYGKVIKIDNNLLVLETLGNPEGLLTYLYRPGPDIQNVISEIRSPGLRKTYFRNPYFDTYKTMKTLGEEIKKHAIITIPGINSNS